MKPTDDNLSFDRLVDDELSPQQRMELIGSLDERPDGWRQCALAFLEHQSWRRQLKAMVTDFDEGELASASFDSVPSTSSRAWGILALAASVLAAFLAGKMLAPEIAASDPAMQLAASDDEKLVQPDKALVEHTLDDRDVVTLLVRDEQGQAKRVRVPLVDVGGGPQSAALAESLPEALRQQLKRQGKDVRLRRRFAPLYFEQNEQLVPMAVPVNDAYIVPVGGPVL